MARFPFARLRSRLPNLRRNLSMPSRKLVRALPVERDTVLAAIHFQRRQVQVILVLSQLRIQRVNPLIQQILLALLLLNLLRLLRFRRRQFLKPSPDALRFRVQLPRLSGQHLPHNPAHLLANLRIPPRLRRLPLQLTQLLLHFHHELVHARQIHLRRFQFRLGQPLLRLEFRHARGFFDNRPPLQRLRRQYQTDAPLLDDGVGIRPQPYAHEHFLNVPQPRHAPVDQIFALPRTVQPPANHPLARLHCQNRLVRRLLPPLSLNKFPLGSRFLSARSPPPLPAHPTPNSPPPSLVL